MGVDWLVLECIKGADLDEVAIAIAATLEVSGWIPVSGGDGSRHIRLVEHGAWIVVDDPYDLASTRWAATLSRELGGTAISLRDHEGELAIERFDGGVRKGGFSNIGRTRERLRRSLAGKMPRETDRELHAATSFLADLGAARSRAKLKAGFDFAPTDSEAALLKIAKLARLPEPRTRYTELEGGLNLFFRRQAQPRPSKRGPPRVRRPKAPPVPMDHVASMRLVHVGHVCGVAKKQILGAMPNALGKREPSKATRSGAEEQYVFVTSHKTWHSFGSAVQGPGARLKTPSGKADDTTSLCAELSSSLRVPVLEVFERQASTTFTVWNEGRKTGDLVMRGDVAVLDASILAPFAPRSARALRAVDLDMAAAVEHEFVAIWLAHEIGLPGATLSGHLKGTLIARTDAHDVAPAGRLVHVDEEASASASCGSSRVWRR